MIEVRELVKVFDTRGHIVRAVDNVSTTVAQGEVLVVIGPSGSGKSTFLRCLNGLEDFDSGSVSIDGLDLANPKTDVNAYRRTRHRRRSSASLKSSAIGVRGFCQIRKSFSGFP